MTAISSLSAVHPPESHYPVSACISRTRRISMLTRNSLGLNSSPLGKLCRHQPLSNDSGMRNLRIREFCPSPLIISPRGLSDPEKFSYSADRIFNCLKYLFRKKNPESLPSNAPPYAPTSGDIASSQEDDSFILRMMKIERIRTELAQVSYELIAEIICRIEAPGDFLSLFLKCQRGKEFFSSAGPIRMGIEMANELHRPEAALAIWELTPDELRTQVPRPIS